MKRYWLSLILWLISHFHSNITFQVVNFGSNPMNLKVSVSGLDPSSVKLSGSTMTILTSTNLMDENSFKEPKKVKQPFCSLLFILCSETMFSSLHKGRKSLHMCMSYCNLFYCVSFSTTLFALISSHTNISTVQKKIWAEK